MFNVLDLILQGYKKQAIDGYNPEKSGQFAVVSNDETLQSLEKFQSRPNRVRATKDFRTITAFADYTLRFGSAATVIFADPEMFKLSAHLDYHMPVAAGVLAPSHDDHLATLQLRRHADYAAWANLTGKSIKQRELGAFLEEYAHTIKSPDAAKLMEMILNFRVERKVSFQKATTLSNDTVQLSYVEQDDTQSRGAISIVEKFYLSVPVFEGSISTDVLVRLRYRMRDGDLSFTLKIDQQKTLEAAAFETEVDELRAAYYAEDAPGWAAGTHIYAASL